MTDLQILEAQLAEVVLEPGDSVVLMTDQHLTDIQRQSLIDKVTLIWGCKVLILDGGMKFGVVHEKKPVCECCGERNACAGGLCGRCWELGYEGRRKLVSEKAVQQ